MNYISLWGNLLLRLIKKKRWPLSECAHRGSHVRCGTSTKRHWMRETRVQICRDYMPTQFHRSCEWRLLTSKAFRTNRAVRVGNGHTGRCNFTVMIHSGWWKLRLRVWVQGAGWASDIMVELITRKGEPKWSVTPLNSSRPTIHEFFCGWNPQLFWKTHWMCSERNNSAYYATILLKQ